MKKRWNKAAALAITACMAISLAACGKSESSGNNGTASGSDAASQEAAGSGQETTEAAAATPVDDSAYDWTVTEAPVVVNERFTTVQGADAIGVDFEDNETDGFTTYANGGRFSMKATNHQMEVDIEDNGSVEHAVQIYYDGFTMAHGCVYTVSFDISSTIERSAMWRVQVNGGDYHAYAMDVVKIGPEMQTVTKEFTMEEGSDPAPRFVFNLGDVTGDESGLPPHQIFIDNISLIVTDSSNAEIIEPAPTPNKVLVNQIGYLPDDRKIVTVTDGEDEHFKVVNAETEETVFIGDYGEAEKFSSTATKIRQGDFSELKAPGEYYIVSAPSGTSYHFKIGEGIYDDVYKDVILMLYKQRCGCEVEAGVAGDFAHAPCHTEAATIYGDTSGKTVDVSGGWHDAGDYGRYVVPGAKTVADLFLTYEDFDYTADDLGIPESGNGVPDVLDEAKYELDWMLKMQDESGGVYHKVTALVFPETSLAVDEKDPLVLAPISTAATADFAAVMAKASRIYKDYDADFSGKALEAAKKAYTYMMSNKRSGYKNPKDITTGEYPDGSLDDEPVWAAMELYLATGDDSYVQDFNNEFKDKFFSYGLGWAAIGYYPMYDVAKAEGVDAELSAYAKDLILKAADKLVADCAKSGFDVGLYSSFPWGSNMNIANEGMLLLMANRLSPNEDYIKLVNRHRDYIFGENAVGYCFVTGYGENSPTDTHHRPSQTLGKTMPGMLVGGPNSDLSDPYAKAVLLGMAPALCYVDNAQSFSCNEITIYWNSPLIYMMTGMSK